MKHWVFVSSSSDMRPVREQLRDRLSDWLDQHELGDVVRPYLWEEETQGGDMLSDQIALQQQILETLDDSVFCTIAIFGERCGVPLEGTLPTSWQRAIAPWKEGEYRLLHPWPKESDAQNEALQQGCFPLSGTIFEVLAAHANSNCELIIGYAADRDIEYQHGVGDMILNGNRHLHRLRKERADQPENEIERDLKVLYRPQVHGLLNFQKALRAKQGLSLRSLDASSLSKDVTRRATERLKAFFALKPGRNPFKRSLTHWRIDDEQRLPGQTGAALQFCNRIRNSRHDERPTLFVIQGPSGCGKSSFLQRGVLAELRYSSSTNIVLVLRPSDLVTPKGAGPLKAFAMAIDNVLGQETLAGKLALPPPRQASEMASALSNWLKSTDRHLVLGLDQFEEVLDELALFADARDVATGWWHVMQFLRAAMKSRRLTLLVTLESLRSDRFEELDIASYLNVRIDEKEIRIGSDEIKQIAGSGFGEAGLELDKDLLHEIGKKFAAFIRDHTSDRPSPLPLAVLWLSGLFDQFEHLTSESRQIIAKSTPAGQTRISPTRDHDNAAGAARLSATLKLEDIGGSDAIRFEDVVTVIAEEAWGDGGGSRASLAAVATPGPDEASKAPDKIESDRLLPSLPGVSDGRPRRQPFSDCLGDATRRSLRDEFLRPSLPEQGRVLGPDKFELDWLLRPFVGVSDGPRPKLLLASDSLGVVERDGVVAEFLRRRLLAPGRFLGPDKQGRVRRLTRFTHQAVIDRWGPAGEWFNENADYFERQLRFQARAKQWEAESRASESIDRCSDRKSVGLAAEILDTNQFWSMVADDAIDVETRLLRDYAMAVFAGASDGRTLVPGSTDGKAYVHIAAQFNMVDLLMRFLTKDPGLRDLAFGNPPQSPLHLAARNAECAVSCLLKHKARRIPKKVDGLEAWHPIALAVSTGRDDIYKSLRPAYDDPNVVVAPRGRTLLGVAAYYGQLGIVDQLLQEQVDADLPDREGYLPVHLAAMRGHTRVVERLAGDFDFRRPGKHGRTALHLAACDGHYRLIEHILDGELGSTQSARAALMVKDNQGVTPLWLASSFKYKRTLEVLLRHCDPNDGKHRSMVGGSILHAAVAKGDSNGEPGPERKARALRTVNLILNDGRVDPNAIDSAGRTAYDLAEHFPEVRRRIREDTRVSKDFRAMSPAMRKVDLSSKRAGVPLRLIEDCPEVLTEQILGSSGLRILLDAGNAGVLAAATDAGFVSVQMLAGQAYELITHPAMSVHSRLRHLAWQVCRMPGIDSVLPRVLLNEVLLASDSEQLLEIVATGVRRPIGAAGARQSVFHDIAVVGDLDRFRKKAALARLLLPIDGWGRRPSQLAADALRLQIQQMEDTLFDVD